MDKARKPNLIEIALIALRTDETISSPLNKEYFTNDPFIAYGEGWISKRKLIEIISNGLMRELNNE